MNHLLKALGFRCREVEIPTQKVHNLRDIFIVIYFISQINELPVERIIFHKVEIRMTDGQTREFRGYFSQKHTAYLSIISSPSRTHTHSCSWYNQFKFKIISSLIDMSYLKEHRIFRWSNFIKPWVALFTQH